MSTKLFAKTLAAVGVIHNREVTPFLIDVYLEALQGQDINQCTLALEELIRTSKFMPKPADILEIVQGDVRGAAQAAWSEVLRLASNISVARSPDPVAEAVVKSMGGWSRIGRTYDRELPFVQREFLERYEAFDKTPALLEKFSGDRVNAVTEVDKLIKGLIPKG